MKHGSFAWKNEKAAVGHRVSSEMEAANCHMLPCGVQNDHELQSS